MIVGAAKTLESSYDCTPDFHTGYRLIYITLAFLTGIIGSYSLGWTVVYSNTHPGVKFINLITLWSGVFAWVIYSVITLISLFGKRRRIIEYFGQLATIQLIGWGVYVFFTTVAVCFPFISIAPFIHLIGIAASFLVMFREHHRRLQAIDLSTWRVVVWAVCFITGALIVLNS